MGDDGRGRGTREGGGGDGRGWVEVERTLESEGTRKGKTYLCPESVFEGFLRFLQRLVHLESVQMSEDSDHLRGANDDKDDRDDDNHDDTSNGNNDRGAMIVIKMMTMIIRRLEE